MGEGKSIEMKAILQERARRLRVESTDAETKMWYFIRNRQLNNHKFIRQYVIEPYIIDFVCREKKLIVELDGSQHIEAKEYDIERSLYLEAQGYKILRFWNNEVLNNIAGVLERILQYL